MVKKVHKTTIVAELSGNHGGNLDRALYLLKRAHDLGADAVKIQTYTEDSLTIKSNRPEFKIEGGLWDGYTFYDLYKKAKTPREWMAPMFSYAKEQGILLFSSPFSYDDVDVLEKVDCPIYKIASFELNDVNLIAYCAKTKKPLVMSTGLATLEEIDRAYDVAIKNGARAITLLHCESRYPAIPSLFNLKTIPFFKKRYNCQVGLSNHALGCTLDLAAIALGADMIEKHFTDSRDNESVDSAFSMDEYDLVELCQKAKDVNEALGVEDVVLTDSDKESRCARRSIYLVKDLKKGEKLTSLHVKSIRPALGLEPYKLQDVLNHVAKKDLSAGEPLKAEDFL